MLHAGVGETHINNILAAINVPVIHHKTLKRRERGLESVTKRTVEEALREEVNKTVRSVHVKANLC